MPNAKDYDRFFSGVHNSSSPRTVLAEGEVSRLINSRPFEGVLTNSIPFEEFDVEFSEGNDKRVFASSVTYGKLLSKGDVQLVAPLENTSGKFLVLVISGRLFLLDTSDCKVYDISEDDLCIPKTSCESNLSYLDNDGGVYGSGGFLNIFNYPNLPILVGPDGARVSRPDADSWETPVSRLGVTAANRSFVVSGYNTMYASDAFGGTNAFAPLTYETTFRPGELYYGQSFNIGTVLTNEYVTFMGRIPLIGSAASEFLGQNVFVSTRNRGYLVNVGSPRDSWGDSPNFITYAGTYEGVAGPHAGTNVGSALVFITRSGRIKSLSQSTQSDNALVETYLDEGLGQYFCECEDNFAYRQWYYGLDHSKSILKFVRDRLYATVHPFRSPAITMYGQDTYTTSHRALAVGSLASETILGSTTNLSWEGFYDYVHPVGMCVLGDDLYVVSKDTDGRIKFFKRNFSKVDDKKSTIYTRGYFSSPDFVGQAKEVSEICIFFRENSGRVPVRVSTLIDGKWVCVSTCEETPENFYRFTLTGAKCKTHDQSIPLKIEVDHKGCIFEIGNITVKGQFYDTSTN